MSSHGIAWVACCFKKAGKIKVTTQPRLSSRITNFSFEKQPFLN
jgi:hypothetical protein